MRCEYVANGLQQRGERMRMRCLQIANTWRTNCNNVANIRRMRGERIATMWRHSANAWRTICNNATFKKQKPYFCNSKTPFLHVKNHTFVMRICNIQKTNTLRTFRECILNGLRMRGEYVYAGTINRTPTAANRLRMRCERIAKHC
ncbi:MAG: hypothetical protein HXN67_07615 [Prevotella pallens]|nr:hypothetical protein [Prevotella pallens]